MGSMYSNPMSQSFEFSLLNAKAPAFEPMAMRPPASAHHPHAAARMEYLATLLEEQFFGLTDSEIAFVLSSETTPEAFFEWADRQVIPDDDVIEDSEIYSAWLATEYSNMPDFTSDEKEDTVATAHGSPSASTHSAPARVAKPCKFGTRCTRRKTCTFSHPDVDPKKSVKECKFGAGCRRKETCRFSHSENLA